MRKPYATNKCGGGSTHSARSRCVNLRKETRGKRRVGVHDEHGVLVVKLGQKDVEGLVERPGLPVDVLNGLEDVRAGRFGSRSRAVGAVVGANDDQVRRRFLLLQGADCSLDLVFLVVRWDQRDARAEICAPASGAGAADQACQGDSLAN